MHSADGEYFVGWTEEDQAIWRARKIRPDHIYRRFKHHMREADLMVALSQCDLPPSEGKTLFVAIKTGRG